ncbi:EamA family transporter [Fructobacillus cardui]|uniref:EamA family transporter n=1 Tax=Fructobacillus cardui TaxID=2893170 RepID=UPI003D357DED
MIFNAKNLFISSLYIEIKIINFNYNSFYFILVKEEEHMNNRKKQVGILFAILGASCWGISGVASQYLFHHTAVHPVSLVGLRLFVGGALVPIDFLDSVK